MSSRARCTQDMSTWSDVGSICLFAVPYRSGSQFDYSHTPSSPPPLRTSPHLLSSPRVPGAGPLPRVWMDIRVGGAPAARVVFELFAAKGFPQNAYELLATPKWREQLAAPYDHIPDTIVDCILGAITGASLCHYLALATNELPSFNQLR